VVIEVVLLGAMVMLILAASLLDIGAMRLRASGTRYRQAQAFHSAEAGIARATADLSRGVSLDWADSDQPFAEGSYRVRLTGRDDGSSVIVSTGEFRRPNGERIAVVLEAVLKPSPAGGLWDTVSWRQLGR